MIILKTHRFYIFHLRKDFTLLFLVNIKILKIAEDKYKRDERNISVSADFLEKAAAF